MVVYAIKNVNKIPKPGILSKKKNRIPTKILKSENLHPHTEHNLLPLHKVRGMGRVLAASSGKLVMVDVSIDTAIV